MPHQKSKQSADSGAPAVQKAPLETQPPPPFPIVGIGASAGGLEALEEFFQHLSADSGMAFVVVPHLDPGHASILTEILQRITPMPVLEAEDHLAVAPNRVYVIPPNRDMVIFAGALQLSMPELPHGQRMPIDVFLRSLADERGKQAIGIVLSGTGRDGTLGLRAILGGGGISLVQEPATAKFDGMPSSAIRAGYASHVLPVAQMPALLLADRSRPGHHPSPSPSPARRNGINRILLLLRTACGHDFSLYKKSTIGRRIERRMALHDIDDIEVYARYLKEQPGELQTLFKELLINVTSFFRDAEAFAILKQEILPQLFADKPEDYVFRAWVAGCATGEEAYSLAILLHEFMDEAQRNFKVQLYATDLDDDAIASARAGLYPASIAQDMTPERLRRFFIKEEGAYRIKKEIREMVVFAVQNIIKDPPFTRLDLLCCRNLMIYLEAELQNRLIPAFHYALKPGGILFLSPSESIGNHTELFEAQNRKWKLYRATHFPAVSRPIMTQGKAWTADSSPPAPEDTMKQAKETNFAELARRSLLQSYAPASVVTDRRGNILYVHGDTGNYLRPAPGQASLSVIDMARDGLQLELRAALQAAAQGSATLDRAASVKNNDGEQNVSFSVRPLADPAAGEDFLLISFQEVAAGTPKKAGRSKQPALPAEVQRIEELERKLAYTKESLQATIEEQQASNEELKSTNEEMQSTNEELQSTNEELETSKEELQSVNEELITVNAELQAKIEQLADLQNDMKNLLDNFSIGTIFLDQYLVIRRFTREAQRIYRLVASDVGRPLGDIKSDLAADHLLAEAQTVLDTLVPCEHEVRTTDGLTYLVRIQPYRTLGNVIEGVVLTFTDISRRIDAEIAVRATRDFAEAIVDTVREPLLVLNEKLQVVSASRSFYRHFQVVPQDTVGQLVYALGNGQWAIPALADLLETVLPRDSSFEGYVVDHDFPGIGRRKMLLNARRLVSGAGEPPMILLAMENVG